MKKTAYGMGENIFKWCNWQVVNIQTIAYKQLIQLNIKTKQNKQPKQKIGTGPKQTFFQRQHADGQQAHGKMLNSDNC